MNGVTGRMGKNPHLIRSLLPIINNGGLRLNENEAIMPRIILTGRNAARLEKLSEETGVKDWTTDGDSLLQNNDYQVYFDAQTTEMRYASLKKAIAAGKHIYCEKPVAMSTTEALELYHLAKEVGIKHDVVADKFWLTGLFKLRKLNLLPASIKRISKNVLRMMELPIKQQLKIQLIPLLNWIMVLLSR